MQLGVIVPVGEERERVGKGRDREGRSGVGAAISTENSQSAANLP